MPDIHLFLGSAPASDDRIDPLRTLLSDEERARVDRIRLDHVRRRQTAALAGLRIALGRTLARDPASLLFGRGPYGKPYLEDGAVSFNLTRSQDRFAIGIADHGALGIDIEFERPMPRLDELARSVFTADELAELADASDAERLPAFYRGWTRKEAFIKAVGTGLSLPLQSFSMRLGAGGENALRHLDEPAFRAAEQAGLRDADWWVGSVVDGFPDNLFGAVAWDRGEPTVRLDPFEWS